MTNNIISLDVFDTAVLRKVYRPDDIFQVIEQKVHNNFLHKRKIAEKETMLKYKFPTLAQIYEFLPEFDMSLEIKTELQLCYPNLKILYQYRQWQKENKTVVFISDMYLSSDNIRQMLIECGYKNPIVYVSCEEKACKATGELFKIVESKLQGKIVKHYGDNYIADIVGARKAGINLTEWDPALDMKHKNIPVVKDPFLQKYLALEASPNKAGRILGSYILPVITSFTDWVLSKRISPEQHIFFCSRDMFLCYKYAQYLNVPNIHYIHASRKSLAPVALNIQINSDIRKKLNLILSAEEQIKYGNKKALEEVRTYLKKQRMRSNDIIVDIGYGGTIQTLVETALGIKLHGLYMQTNEDIDSNLLTEEYLKRKCISACLISELPFCSPEDNIVGYKDGEPVFKKDLEKRKELAQEIYEIFKLNVIGLKQVFKNLSTFDIEQILIWLQYYPPQELLELYNSKIFSNRTLIESAINFDREKIKNGELIKCYELSYNKELFRQMLQQDEELKYLEYLLH